VRNSGLKVSLLIDIGIKVSPLDERQRNLDFRYSLSLTLRHMFKFLFILLTIGPGLQSSFAQQGFAPGDPQVKASDAIVAPDPTQEKLLKMRRVKKYYGELGADVRNYTYEEPGFVKHSGIMLGLWGNYLQRESWGGWGADGNLTFSNSNKYEGGLCEYDPLSDTTTCTPYETTKQTDIISKWNLWLYLSASDILRFKTGGGYRYLSNSVPEPGFYLRTGAWIYLPLGMEILLNSNNIYKWEFELTYDHIVAGGIKSNLSNVSSSFDDVYMTQTGYGINTNLQMRYKNRYLFSFYYETWNLNLSDVVYAAPSAPFREPANKATSIGFRFGYDFY